MGGKGSGRQISTETLLKNSQTQKFTPIASKNGEGLFIPNLSGDHSAGHTGTPNKDLDLANKKYVDDAIAGVGGGSGSVTTIKEAGVQVGDADIITLDFDGDDFNTSEAPDKEVNITINDAGIDHNFTTNTHNLTTDINHASITGTHNLTTDINHDALTNFAANEHFTEASISHTNILNIGTNTHAQIDTAITNSTSHIANTSNPHSVTLAQVGGTTDHTALSNIGTNTHAQIDTAVTASTNHIADSTQAHSDYLKNDANDTTSGVITAAGLISSTGQIQINSARFLIATISKAGIVDNSATGIFSITTTNETGDTDAGTYSCKVTALVAHGSAAANSVNTAAKVYEGAFCRAMQAVGTGVNSAVTQVFLTASAATTAATKDVGAVTMTVVETSEYQNDVTFTIDLTGTGIASAQINCLIELTWWGLTTAPTITAL